MRTRKQRPQNGRELFGLLPIGSHLHNRGHSNKRGVPQRSQNELHNSYTRVSISISLRFFYQTSFVQRSHYIFHRYFKQGSGEGENSEGGAAFGAVIYKASDCPPAPPVYSLGPFAAPQRLLAALDKLEYVVYQKDSIIFF